MAPELHPDPTRRHRHPSVFARIRGNFLAGLIIVAPIGLTFWLIWTVVGWVDGWVWPFVPAYLHPEELLNTLLGTNETNRVSFDVRGIGVVVFLIFTIIVGWLGKGLFGRSMLRWGENLVDRMPVVRSIYNGVKQIAETVFSQRDTSFDTACLVEYPKAGIWAIAFISTNAKGEIKTVLPGEDEIATVFLPTTPNPTSGFLLFLPRKNVIELQMTVEDAAKLVISAGLVYPATKEKPEGLPTKV